MRKTIIGVLAFALVTLGLGDESLAQKVPVLRGELRIVDKSVNNWAFITFNVMDHLIELDRDGKLVPRLATSWRWLDEQTLEMKLRRGVRFHNGEAFLFLYSPTLLYAANKAVEFVPYASTYLLLHETGVTDQHWSRRNGPKQK